MIEIERNISPQGYIVSSKHFAVRIRIWKQSQDCRAALAIRKPEAFDRNRVPQRKLFEIEHKNFEEGEEGGDPKVWAKDALREYREEIDALLDMLEEDNA